MVTYLSTAKCRCNGVEMLQVRIKNKFHLNSWAYISRTKMGKTSKFDVVL